MKGGYECAGVSMLVMMVLMLAQVLVSAKDALYRRGHRPLADL